MGLFKKEFCSLCGQPKGLLGPKLADGSCLCSKCADTGSEQLYAFDMKNFPRRELREMTLEDFKGTQALLEENRNKLEEFEPTVAYCNVVHIDEDSEELVFASDIKPLKEHPEQTRVVVHSLHDLAFGRLIYQLEKVKEGLLNDYVIADIILLAAFDEPFAKLYAVTLRKKAKLRISGVFNKTYEPDEECTKLLEHLDRYYSAHIADDGREGRLWEAVACAKRELYMDSTEVADLLKEFHGGDKAKMKEIRKQYGL